MTTKQRFIERIQTKPDVRIDDQFLVRYHQQALSQADWQFKLSIAVAIIGFSIVATSFFVASPSGSWAGVPIEALAALLFRQATRTRERATSLYDRLRADRDRRDAIAVAESIDDTDVRNAVKAELALRFTKPASDS
jgi:hypothetical protein